MLALSFYHGNTVKISIMQLACIIDSKETRLVNPCERKEMLQKVEVLLISTIKT